MTPKHKLVAIYAILFLLIVLTFSGNGPCDNTVIDLYEEPGEWVDPIADGVTPPYCPRDYEPIPYDDKGVSSCRRIED